LEPGLVNIRLIEGVTTETLDRLDSNVTIQSISEDSTRMVAEEEHESVLTEIAQMREVYFIAPYVEPELQAEIDSQLIGGGAWFMDDYSDPEEGDWREGNPNEPYRKHGNYGAYVNQIGYTGEGVTIAIADSGIGDGTVGDAGHPDLSGRVIGGYDFESESSDEGRWADGHGHGTHVTGSAAGDTYGGTGETLDFADYYMAQGLAYDSELFATRILDNKTYMIPDEYYPIVEEPAQRSDAYIHSNSWRVMTDGAYVDADEDFDQAVRDAERNTNKNRPMVITVAAGNEGYGGSTTTTGSPGNAKNVITVGATETYNPDDGFENAENVAHFSSRGWTQDDRVKPDVVAPGEGIYSLTPEGGYTQMSGTSMATPAVAGATAVVVEWYEETYGERPSPAMVKSILINTANELNPDVGNTTGPIPNQDEGWGIVDISKLEYPTDDPIEFIFDDQESLLQTGEYDEHRIRYEDEDEPLKITLTWTDKEGKIGDEPTLKNDLDLEVVTPEGDVIRGNAFDLSGDGESDDGFTYPEAEVMADFDTGYREGYDNVNNVENVFIPSGELESGTYTVRIMADQIPSDSNNDGEANQDYALVAQNAIREFGFMDPDDGEEIVTEVLYDLETEIAPADIEDVDEEEVRYRYYLGDDLMGVEYGLYNTDFVYGGLEEGYKILEVEAQRWGNDEWELWDEDEIMIKISDVETAWKGFIEPENGDNAMFDTPYDLETEIEPYEWMSDVKYRYHLNSEYEGTVPGQDNTDFVYEDLDEGIYTLKAETWIYLEHKDTYKLAEVDRIAITVENWDGFFCPLDDEDISAISAPHQEVETEVGVYDSYHVDEVKYQYYLDGQEEGDPQYGKENTDFTYEDVEEGSNHIKVEVYGFSEGGWEYIISEGKFIEVQHTGFIDPIDGDVIYTPSLPYDLETEILPYTPPGDHLEVRYLYYLDGSLEGQTSYPSVDFTYQIDWYKSHDLSVLAQQREIIPEPGDWYDVGYHEIEITLTDEPQPPSWIRIEKDEVGENLEVIWEDIGFLEYNIYYSEDKYANFAEWDLLATVEETNHIHENALGGENYYIVRSSNGEEESDSSSIAFCVEKYFGDERPRHYISVPMGFEDRTGDGKLRASDLVMSIEDDLESSEFISDVVKWDHMSRGYSERYYYDDFAEEWTDDFVIEPGDGIGFAVKDSFTWHVNATDTEHSITYSDERPRHYTSIPYTFVDKTGDGELKASDLVMSIEGDLETSEYISDVVKWDYISRGYSERYYYDGIGGEWTDDFVIEPGDGIGFAVQKAFYWEIELIESESESKLYPETRKDNEESNLYELGGFFIESYDGEATFYDGEEYLGNISVIEFENPNNTAINEGTGGSWQNSHGSFAWDTNNPEYGWSNSPPSLGNHVYFVNEVSEENVEGDDGYVWSAMRGVDGDMVANPQESMVGQYEPIPTPRQRSGGEGWIEIEVESPVYTDWDNEARVSPGMGTYDEFVSYSVFIKGGEYGEWTYLGETDELPENEYDGDYDDTIEPLNESVNPEKVTTGMNTFEVSNGIEYGEKYEFKVRMNLGEGLSGGYENGYDHAYTTWASSKPIAIRCTITIENIEQLQQMEEDLGGFYTVVDDIDARETEKWNRGAGFDPIGDSKEPFTGIFDGNEYEISELHIDRQGTDYVGLLGYIDDEAEVTDVRLVDVDVSGNNNVGALCGLNSGLILGSYASGDVNGGHRVGGLIGLNDEGTVQNSYASSEVNGEYHAGGLVGLNYKSSVEASYAIGDVSITNDYVGGLVGVNQESTVINSYSTGKVSGRYAGGLIGVNQDGYISASFWDVETSRRDSSDGGTGLTTAEMQDVQTYKKAGWDITAVNYGETDENYLWNIVDGYSYPFHSWKNY